MEDDPMLHEHDAAAARPDGTTGPERRAAPRIDWPVTAELLRHVSVGRGGVPGGPARTINVSLTGVLVAVPFECTPGEELNLRFPLDRGDELAVVARVVRIADESDPAAGEWLAGCEFVAVPVKERCRLAKFLMRRRADVIAAHARESTRR
jgi:hypothetical protein